MKFILMNVETKFYVKDNGWPVWMPEDRYTKDIKEAQRWDGSAKPLHIKAECEVLMTVEA